MNLSRCCRESVDGKNTSMDREAIKKSIGQQKVAWWIAEAVEHLSRRNLETLMDWDCDKISQDKKKEGLDRRKSDNLSRIYREIVELEENEFFKEDKHKEMNATSKLLKHRSNQHIKLSKNLSTYMQSIQDPKYTHTRTHTKQV